MEVEDQVAAQVPTSVEKVKVIVTVMLIVLAAWDADRAMVWMTTATLLLGSLLIMTAAMTQVQAFY